LTGVDQANNQINLNQPFPAAMGNPDDPNGTWPVGTRIANADVGATYQYIAVGGGVLPDVDQWYDFDKLGNRQSAFQ